MNNSLSNSPILPGLDALRLSPEGWLPALTGKRIGLLTNHTGRALDGTPTLKVLRELGLNVTALFSPEHGPAGTREGKIESGQTADGLPIHSLYGTTRRPTAAMLDGLDAVICDIQDVGARFYTYTTTLAYIMEEGAGHGLAVLVLDRPNPIGGTTIEGPGLHDEYRSFVGHINVPVRHGLTLGELAHLHRADAGLDVQLTVVPVKNWQRSLHWPETGLPWTAPSPNLPDYASAAWYPGLCVLEYSGVAVGRGTDAPFQIVGAPWLDPEQVLGIVASRLESYGITGEPLEYTPTRATHESQKCQAIRFRTTQPAAVPAQVVPLGLCLLAALHQVHPEAFDAQKLQLSHQLVGSVPVLAALAANDIDQALHLSAADAAQFRARREPFLLY